MTSTPTEPDVRELRLRIGRLRRRIDGRVRLLERGTRRLLSWRTLVERYPGWAALGALGAGLSVSAALRGGRLLRWLGSRLVRHSADQIVQRLWQEAHRLWTASTADPTAAEPHGTYHDPT